MKEFSIEDIKHSLSKLKPDIEIISNYYKNNTTKIVCKCKIDGHEWETNWMCIKKNKGCPICNKTKRFDIEYIKNKLNSVNSNVLVLDEKYDGKKRTVKLKCKIDGHEWHVRAGLALTGTGCPVCSGRLVSDNNRLSILRPDLIRYFKNKNDAYNNTVNSTVVVQCICPSCGNEKSVKITNLSFNGFFCERCSDNMSMPEKFCINLLTEIGVVFEYQKRFDWANGKIYDFYIPSLNMIIETHGIQHYVSGGFGRCDGYEQSNDMKKLNLALHNGINKDDYIVVDCRHSNINWFKAEFSKSIGLIYDLSKINWNELYIKSQKSKLLEICEYWSTNHKKENINDLVEIFKLSKFTILKYLKHGDSIGICNYKTISNKKFKCVNQYTLCNVFIKSYSSVSCASIDTGIDSSSITKSCKGKYAHAGGYIWRYKKTEGDSNE